MEIVLVAALDEASVIGFEGAMPWHLPADLAHFKRVTMGYPLIMGRRTYETLEISLSGREMIIVTRQEGYQAKDAQVTMSLEEALRRAEASGAKRAMIGGGATIYAQTLPFADRMILTVIHERHQGDTFFPGFNSQQWELEFTEFRPADDRHASAMTFVTLKNKTEAPREVQPLDVPGELPNILRF